MNETAELDINRLRGALAVCVAALTDARIGTSDYMEGDQIYSDFRNAAVIGMAALRATDKDTGGTP